MANVSDLAGEDFMSSMATVPVLPVTAINA